jgi:glutamine synthetase
LLIDNGYFLFIILLVKEHNILGLKKNLKKAGTKFIDMKYVSLTGVLHHITIPFERFEKIVHEGVGADGSSLPGYKAVEKGDMLLLPDLSTFFFDPFFESKTVSFLSSVYSPDTLKPFQRDTRHVAKLAVQYLKRELNTEAFFQPELEFYIFDDCNFGEGSGYNYYRIDTEDKEKGHPTYPIRYRGGYHIGPPADRFFNIRNALADTLAMCNIKTKYHHHEVGPKGQMEVELLFSPAVQAADNIFIAKYIFKCIGQKYNKYVTFMPKPLYNEPGCGLHLHQYLGSKKHSLFYRAKHKHNLSKLCLHYIAGILHHSRAICAFTNPSTNSYKRLIPGFEAPTYTDFAVGSRKTAIRLPKYLKNQKMMEIEYRIPDATANSYLAIAAILLAGIDGIKNKSRPMYMRQSML